jgi:UDP-glucose 4-epimerase
LAHALLKIFSSNQPIKFIGPRHAEKLYETLLTKEERLVSQDLGAYFKVPADNRDLNYGKYFDQGRKQIKEVQEYTSSNTNQLSIDDVVQLLRQNDYVKRALKE